MRLLVWLDWADFPLVGCRGVHMKDLISLHVALSDAVEGGLINFRKMAQLSLIFKELQELQNATPPPGANLDLVNTLRVGHHISQLLKKIPKSN